MSFQGPGPGDSRPLDPTDMHVASQRAVNAQYTHPPQQAGNHPKQ